MKKSISLLLAIVAWFAVLTQYYLMVENQVTPIQETTIRFLSFFTILTNSLVAIYFSFTVVKEKAGFLSGINKPGTLTAVTVYITIVGLVYQILLRPIWDPQGLQRIIDELLHSVIPLSVICFWFFYEKKSLLKYNQIPWWLIYPLGYLVFILIRGSFSGFYPYPFVDVVNLGFIQVLINSAGFVLLFSGVSGLFIKIGRTLNN